VLSKAIIVEGVMSIGKVVPVLTIFTILFLFLGINAWGQPSMSVDMATGRITIRASRWQIDEVEKAKAEFPLETRQIQIKARLLELSENATRKFGINLERLTGVEVPVGVVGEGTALELAGGALQYTFYSLTLGKEKLEAILDALVSTGEAKVLSAPQVSTLSGQVAGIYVVQDVPYLISEEVKRTVTTELGIVEEIIPAKWGYVTVGIILQVQPDVVGEDLVQMSIVPMVARYDTTEFGKEHPVFYREIAPTNITVRSGETIVIGGLMREEETESIAGLPILSQLPVIGSLFRRTEKVISKTNLVVTVEPRIITPREIKGRSKRIFTFTYALAEDMARQIGDMISPQGMIELNPKEASPNSVLVRDDEDRVKVIEGVLNGIGTFVEQRRQKLFSLQFSSAEPTREMLLSLLSSKGDIQIVRENNSLIVEDGAYQVFQIEKAISSLEKSNSIPQTKTFSLEYVQAGEIVSSLGALLSPQGSIEIVGNSLVVKDNNWVIEQIRKRIEELDVSGNSS
jgi:type II secretory pathway component GspD/PulD (secretin)